MTALHSSASPKSEGTPQVASEARGNKANFAWVQHYIHHFSPQTALRDSTSLQIAANPQFVSEAKDNFRKDDDVRWQWSGATWTTRQGCPQGERGGVHQFGVPPKGNANFAWVQHFIHHLAPQGMAGFVLANGSMS